LAILHISNNPTISSITLRTVVGVAEFMKGIPGTFKRFPQYWATLSNENVRILGMHWTH
jgi:hypothetical protein